MFYKLLLLMPLFVSIGYTNDDIVIYHAYGNSHQLIVQGRMAKKKTFKKVRKDDGWFRNFWRRVRQVEADEIENATVNLFVKNETFQTKGDDEGYFEFDVKTKENFPMGYQKISLKIEGNNYFHETNATIIDTTPLVGIISDFDDTIIVSEVGHKMHLVSI